MFETLGLNRLHGVTMIDNHRTIESILATGGKSEGVARDFYCKDGVFIDAWQYSILAKDYFADKSSSSSRSGADTDELIVLFNELLPSEEIDVDTEMEDVPSWDSLTHMAIMVELKDRFSADFSASEIAEATSIRAILELLNN